jgi:hypothetical protein
MVELKSASSANQRCQVAFNLAEDVNYVNRLLSVYTTNYGA